MSKLVGALKNSLGRTASAAARWQRQGMATASAYGGGASGSSSSSSSSGRAGVVGIPSTSRRPIGGFRGALTGFAFGLAATSAWGIAYVLSEYQSTTKAIATAMQELEDSTQQLTQAYARIKALEDSVARTTRSAATTDEVRSRYGDLVRVYNALHEDVFESKRKLYDLERDVNRSFGVPLSRQADGRLV